MKANPSISLFGNGSRKLLIHKLAQDLFLIEFKECGLHRFQQLRTLKLIGVDTIKGIMVKQTNCINGKLIDDKYISVTLSAVYILQNIMSPSEGE